MVVHIQYLLTIIHLATILRIGIENIFIVKIEDKKIVFSFVSKESVLTDAEQKITELNNIFADSENNMVSELKQGNNGKSKILFNLGVHSVEYENLYIYF